MLTGVENFRDFGGYPVGPDRRVKRGLLYRSGRPSAATEADEALLHRLGISTIVDLRLPDERREHQTGDWNARYQTITSDVGGDVNHWRAFLRSGNVSATTVEAYMLELYRSIPYHERFIDLFSRYFRALATADGAVLVHCTAGKDRTGIIVALTHYMLSVAREDIYYDFLLTNRDRSYETHGASVQQALSEEAGQPIEEPAVRAAMGTPPEYLDATFDALRARSGSVEAYLEEALGVDGAIREMIQTRLLVRSSELGAEVPIDTPQQ